MSTSADSVASDQPRCHQATADLLIAYHSSARLELVQRLAHRDTALALFLTAIAVIFGIAFGTDNGLTDDSAPFLYIIPLLGIGATFVHVQHNGVVGALGEYLGQELHDASLTLGIAHEVPDGNSTRVVPVQWDASRTLLSMEGQVFSRLLSGLVLLVAPQVLAVAIATFELFPAVISVCGSILGLAAAGISAFAISRSHREREARTARLRKHHSAKECAQARQSATWYVTGSVSTSENCRP